MILFRRRPFHRMNIHALHSNFCSLIPVQLPSRMYMCLPPNPHFSMTFDCFSKSESQILRLKNDGFCRESHLWYVLPGEVKSEGLLNRYFELLSPSERDNVLGMRGIELQKRALLARALVRTTISRYTNHRVDPRSLNFKKNSHGKPEVEWKNADGWQPPPLHFNLSHTSSLIACAVTVDSPIGIDVENKKRKLKNEILAFARRYFSSHEVEHLSSISYIEIQRQQFIKLWTLKEAYVKALGKGFSASPFKTFTIRFRNAAKGGVDSSGDVDSEMSEISVEPFGPVNLTRNWQFSLLELAGSHYAAICMERHKTIGGKENAPIELTVWRSIPFVEEECVTRTDAAVPIGR